MHQVPRDIAFQITQHDTRYAQHVESCLTSLEETSTLAILWQTLFVDIFVDDDTTDSTVYMVLDALDEAFHDQRAEFFKLEIGKISVLVAASSS